MISTLCSSRVTADTDTWKNGRKAIKSLLTPSAIEEQLPLQIAEATQLLNEILEKPDVRPVPSLTCYCMLITRCRSSTSTSSVPLVVSSSGYYMDTTERPNSSEEAGLNTSRFPSKSSLMLPLLDATHLSISSSLFDGYPSVGQCGRGSPTRSRECVKTYSLVCSTKSRRT